MRFLNPGAEEAESGIPVAHWPGSLVIVQGQTRPQKKKKKTSMKNKNNRTETSVLQMCTQRQAYQHTCVQHTHKYKIIKTIFK